MASSFNLTAQINLRGPSNIRTIVADIRRQLGSVTVDINPQINNNSLRNITQLSGNLRGLNASLDATVISARNASTAITNLGNAIGAVGGRTVQQNMAAVNAATQNLNRNLTSTTRASQTAATQMEEFGRQSALAIRRFAAFSIVTSAVYSFINAVSKGTKEFIEFDKEFIRLQQVTGESAKQLQALSGEISRLSTQYGVASKELTTVAVTLAQAGITAGDTKRALEALAQSALSPSFDNMNETVEGSIALMKQFGIEANGLSQALGSVSAVSAQFAVEASDIITAIQRTGGVFATASKGVAEGSEALNQFIALFTSVRATTRESAETIATGLRTIFTRIQRSTTIDALRQFGITLTDLEGKFVGPYEAVKRLSEGLKSLDPRDLRFSSIVEELGGFRQIGKVIPLIQQFSTAQQALKVAQQGQGSLAKDAATAQLSLANQIAKVREEFLALIRSIGQSDSFRSFVSLSLDLASALIKVADAAKNVLPAITAIATIKGISALTQFGTGFGRGLTRPRGFATGGYVPGSGNRDTVPAMLTPGEFVIRKKAVETIGVNKLHSMNRYANGGSVQKMAIGGMPKGRGLSGRRGARSRFKELTPEEIAQLSTEELIVYGKKLAQNIFTTGGAGVVTGMEFVPVPKSRIVPELESSLKTHMGQKGFWREKVSPFGRGVSQTKIDKAKTAESRESALKKQEARMADEVAARAQNWASIKSGSAIDNYLLRSLQEPVLSDYKTVRGGGSLSKQFHNTRLRQSVNKALDDYDDFDYSPSSIDKLVSGMAAKRFAFGGMVQKFARGGKPSKRFNLSAMPANPEQAIMQNMMGPDGRYRFGVAALRSGGPRVKTFLQTSVNLDKEGKKQIPVDIHVGALSNSPDADISKSIESDISGSLRRTIGTTANKLAKLFNAGLQPISGAGRKAVLQGTTLSSAIGSIFEGALGLLGAPYIDKPESIKSMDFPFGMGPKLASSFFGDSSLGSIPTDVTRTYGGAGKNASDFKNQISRFYRAVEGQKFTKAKIDQTSAMAVKRVRKQGLLSDILSRVPANFNTSSSAFAIRQKYGLSRSGLTSRGLKSSLDIAAKSGKEQEFLQDIRDAISKGYATGGSVQDTVPALLTPGEFVINKKAASKLGASRLHALNRADKIQGYNKGGFVGVQKFTFGGEIGAALNTLPQKEIARLQGSIQRNVAAFDRLEQMIKGWPVDAVANATKNLARSLDKGATDVNVALQNATTSTSWGSRTKQSPKLRGALGLAFSSSPETRKTGSVGSARTFTSFTGFKGEDLSRKALIQSGAQSGQIQESYLKKLTAQAERQFKDMGYSLQKTSLGFSQLEKGLLVFNTELKRTGNAQQTMEAATRTVTQSYRNIPNQVFRNRNTENQGYFAGIAQRASTRATAYQNTANTFGISVRGDINAVMASFNRSLASTAKTLAALSTASNYTSKNISVLGSTALTAVKAGAANAVQGIGGSVLGMVGLGRFSTAGRRAAAAGGGAAAAGAAGGTAGGGGGMGGGMGGMLPYMLPMVGGVAVEEVSKRLGGESTDVGRKVSNVGSSVINYASIGAMAGSIIGPWGTAIGAGAGILYGLYDGFKKAEEAAVEFAEKTQRSNVERVVSENMSNIATYASDPASLKKRSAAVEAFSKIAAEESKLNIIRSSTDTDATFAQRLASGQQAGGTAAQQILSAEMMRTGKSLKDLSIDPALLDQIKKNILEADETYRLTQEQYKASIDRVKSDNPLAAKRLEEEKNRALKVLEDRLMARATAETEAALEAMRNAKTQQKIQEAADRVLQKYSQTFAVLDQLFNRSSFEIDRTLQQINNIANGLQANTGISSIEQDINILKNPKAYSEAERTAAFKSGTAQFPGLENTMRTISEFGDKTEKLIRSELSLVQPGTPADTKENQIEAIKNAVFGQIDTVFKGDQSLKNQVNTILRNAQESSKNEDLDIDKIIKDIIATTGGDLSSQVQELIIKSLQGVQQIFDVIVAKSKQVAEINQAFINRNAAFAGQRAENNLAVREAMGANITPEERMNTRLVEMQNRLGFNNTRDVNVGNIVALRRRRIDERKQISDQIAETQEQIKKKPSDKEAIERLSQLQNKFAILNQRIQATEQELVNFGSALQNNVNDVIAKIQKRTQTIEAGNEAKQERLITELTSTPSQRAEQANIREMMLNALAGNPQTIQRSLAANQAYNEAMAPMNQQINTLRYVGAVFSPSAQEAIRLSMADAMRSAQEVFARQSEAQIQAFFRYATERKLEPEQRDAQLATLVENLARVNPGVDPQLLQEVVANLRATEDQRQAALARDENIARSLTTLQQLYTEQKRANDALNNLDRERVAQLEKPISTMAQAVDANTVRIGTEINNLSIAINGLNTTATNMAAATQNAANAALMVGGGGGGGGRAKGGLIYANSGSFVDMGFKKRGSDTIPAITTSGQKYMLADGEYIVNAKSTKKYKPLIDAINSDTLYAADGMPPGWRGYDNDPIVNQYKEAMANWDVRQGLKPSFFTWMNSQYIKTDDGTTRSAFSYDEKQRATLAYSVVENRKDRQRLQQIQQLSEQIKIDPITGKPVGYSTKSSDPIEKEAVKIALERFKQQRQQEIQDTEQEYQDLKARAARGPLTGYTDEESYVRRADRYDELRFIRGEFGKTKPGEMYPEQLPYKIAERMREESLGAEATRGIEKQEFADFQTRLAQEKSSSFFDKVVAEASQTYGKNTETGLTPLIGKTLAGYAGKFSQFKGNIVGSLLDPTNVASIFGGVAGLGTKGATLLDIGTTATGLTAGVSTGQIEAKDAANTGLISLLSTLGLGVAATAFGPKPKPIPKPKISPTPPKMAPAPADVTPPVTKTPDIDAAPAPSPAAVPKPIAAPADVTPPVTKSMDTTPAPSTLEEWIDFYTKQGYDPQTSASTARKRVTQGLRSPKELSAAVERGQSGLPVDFTVSKLSQAIADADKYLQTKPLMQAAKRLLGYTGLGAGGYIGYSRGKMQSTPAESKSASEDMTSTEASDSYLEFKRLQKEVFPRRRERVQPKPRPRTTPSVQPTSGITQAQTAQPSDYDPQKWYEEQTATPKPQTTPSTLPRKPFPVIPPEQQIPFEPEKFAEEQERETYNRELKAQQDAIQQAKEERYRAAAARNEADAEARKARAYTPEEIDRGLNRGDYLMKPGESEAQARSERDRLLEARNARIAEADRRKEDAQQQLEQAQNAEAAALEREAQWKQDNAEKEKALLREEKAAADQRQLERDRRLVSGTATPADKIQEGMAFDATLGQDGALDYSSLKTRFNKGEYNAMSPEEKERYRNYQAQELEFNRRRAEEARKNVEAAQQPPAAQANQPAAQANQPAAQANQQAAQQAAAPTPRTFTTSATGSDLEKQIRSFDPYGNLFGQAQLETTIAQTMKESGLSRDQIIKQLTEQVAEASGFKLRPEQITPQMLAQAQYANIDPNLFKKARGEGGVTPEQQQEAQKALEQFVNGLDKASTRFTKQGIPTGYGMSAERLVQLKYGNGLTKEQRAALVEQEKRRRLAERKALVEADKARRAGGGQQQPDQPRPDVGGAQQAGGAGGQQAGGAGGQQAGGAGGQQAGGAGGQPAGGAGGQQAGGAGGQPAGGAGGQPAGGAGGQQPPGVPQPPVVGGAPVPAAGLLVNGMVPVNIQAANGMIPVKIEAPSLLVNGMVPVNIKSPARLRVHFDDSINNYARIIANALAVNLMPNQNPTPTAPAPTTGSGNTQPFNININFPQSIKRELIDATTIRLDPNVISKLTSFTTDFNKVIESLNKLNINIPQNIFMVGQHNVDVKIDAKDLQGLIPGITAMIMGEVSTEMAQIWTDSGGELGPIPSIG